jgi:D-alanine-D-alanine ligase
MSEKRKLNVLVLFGGRSAEHEISLRSAQNVVAALDKERFNPILVGIDKDGKWYTDEAVKLLNTENPKLFKLNTTGKKVAITGQNEAHMVSLDNYELTNSVDVVFPVLHGPYGEDGTMQGLLKLANVPFVGSSVLGSAVGMDKEVMKRLLESAQIPVAKYAVYRDYEKIVFDEVVEKLSLPFFVKPANMGSSVGVHKVKNQNDFEEAIKDAFQYDRKILIEEFVEGREIECAVLGNDFPEASIPGEIVVHTEFYSYETKYIDEKGAKLEIPANISEETKKQIQNLSIKTFKTLCAEGLARVDFFLKKTGDILVNEINTMPGFTSVSMYPLLWKASGVSYTELISKLIDLALKRFEKEKKLKNSFFDV